VRSAGLVDQPPASLAATEESTHSNLPDIRRWTWALLVIYLIILITLMIVRQTMPTPDILLVFAAIVALMLRRVRAFLRDWIPLILIFLAWEASRGLTNYTGLHVHSDSIIWIERMLLFGTTAPEFLQSALRIPGYVTGLDKAMTAV
jgi:hypothetical protein